MISVEAQAVLAAFGIQVAAWAVAALKQTEHFYDLTGGLTYLAVSAFVASQRRGGSVGVAAANWHGDRTSLLTFCVWLWACRLAGFLFWRVSKVGKDSRFDRVKTQPIRFLIYWLVQGLWCTMMLVPLLLASESPVSLSSFGTDAVGLAVYFIGFVVEVTADVQKQLFRSDAKNAGKFINVGLWSVVRFPNYAGEITLHCGMALLSGSYAAIASPVFCALLLIRLSGIPIQERQGHKRWGESADYKKYLSDTPRLFPGVF